MLRDNPEIFQFPWCVGEFNERDYAYVVNAHISIPVVRGGVQQDSGWQRQSYLPISIPVVRGGVQLR